MTLDEFERLVRESVKWANAPYVIIPAAPDHPVASIVCLRCGSQSFNPNDVAQHYCGHCHRFHDDPPPPG